MDGSPWVTATSSDDFLVQTDNRFSRSVVTGTADAPDSRPRDRIGVER
jgi:hypothetical protein